MKTTGCKLEEEQSVEAPNPQELHIRCSEQLDITDDQMQLRAEGAVQRRLEMARWTQDWQQAGEWLLSGGSHPVESWYSSSTQHDFDREKQVACNNNCAAARTTETTAETNSGISGERLERKRSLRLRMRRGVSDGYVFALRTAAAVRRAATAK
jgi:hypothetical protein